MGPWLLPAGLLVLGAIPLAAGAEATGGNARFLASPAPVLHILAAAVYIVLGAFQFAPAFRRRCPAAVPGAFRNGPTQAFRACVRSGTPAAAAQVAGRVWNSVAGWARTSPASMLASGSGPGPSSKGSGRARLGVWPAGGAAATLGLEQVDVGQPGQRLREIGHVLDG